LKEKRGSWRSTLILVVVLIFLFAQAIVAINGTRVNETEIINNDTFEDNPEEDPEIIKIIKVFAEPVKAFIGEIIHITAILTDENETPIEGEEVEFYKDDEFLDTAITDEEGIASFNLATNMFDLGTYIITAKHEDFSDDVLIELMDVDLSDGESSGRNGTNDTGGGIATDCTLISGTMVGSVKYASNASDVPPGWNVTINNLDDDFADDSPVGCGEPWNGVTLSPGPPVCNGSSCVYNVVTYSSSGFSGDNFSVEVESPDTKYYGKTEAVPYDVLGVNYGIDVTVDLVDCNLTSVNITPLCTGGNSSNCEVGENIQIDSSYRGDCPSTSWIQVDSTNNSNCIINRTGGDINGMNVSCTGSLCTQNWTIPTVPAGCEGETIYATWAGLYNDSGLTNLINVSSYVSGSFVTFYSPANDPPTISGVPDNSTNEDTMPPSPWINLSYYANDTEDGPFNLTYTLQSQSNATLINCSIVNSHMLNCSMPLANASGSSTLVINVTDTGGASDTDDFIITVNPVNDAPTVLSYSDDSPVTVGDNVTFTVNWSDIDSSGTQLFVCNQSNISSSGCFPLTKEYCMAPGPTSNDYDLVNPKSCQYTTTPSDFPNATYYLKVCDSDNGP